MNTVGIKEKKKRGYYSNRVQKQESRVLSSSTECYLSHRTGLVTLSYTDCHMCSGAVQHLWQFDEANRVLILVKSFEANQKSLALVTRLIRLILGSSFCFISHESFIYLRGTQSKTLIQFKIVHVFTNTKGGFNDVSTFQCLTTTFTRPSNLV